MEGWELLGKASEEERRRPLWARIAECEGRSLLLHEGTVYELREQSVSVRDGQYFFTLTPMAGIDEKQADDVRRMAGYYCISDRVPHSSHPDREVAEHVNVIRRARAIETFLTDLELTDRGIWTNTPLES